jgi:hypothetical protein
MEHWEQSKKDGFEWITDEIGVDRSVIYRRCAQCFGDCLMPSKLFTIVGGYREYFVLVGLEQAHGGRCNAFCVFTFNFGNQCVVNFLSTRVTNAPLWFCPIQYFWRAAPIRDFSSTISGR